MSLSVLPQQSHAPSRTLAAARSWSVLGPVFAVVAALALGYGLSGRTGVFTAPENLVVLTAAVAAVSALLLVFSLVTRSTRRRRFRTQESLAWIEQLHLCGSPVDLVGPHPEPVTEDEEAPQVRALRLHVRTLEAALEEQTVRLSQLNKSLHGQRGRDLERVLVTVGALRARVSRDQDAQQVLDRVEAAVARLDAPRTAARPTLPAPVPGSRTPASAPPRPAVAAPASPQPAPAVAAVVSAPGSPAAPAPVPQDQVVLPVPAPARQATEHPKRRLRRSAA